MLIAQNRQAAGDRIRSDVEYAANIKAGLEVTQLHTKLDTLYAETMARLAGVERASSAAPEPEAAGSGSPGWTRVALEPRRRALVPCAPFPGVPAWPSQRTPRSRCSRFSIASSAPGARGRSEDMAPVLAPDITFVFPGFSMRLTGRISYGKLPGVQRIGAR